MRQYNGCKRPAIAELPTAGQESVWDYPRPPRLVPDARHVIVRKGDYVLADTICAPRVLETASPPTFYLPLEDIDRSLIIATAGTSICEWKGAASYWTVVLPDGLRIEAVGWSYERPKADFAALTGWLSLYPAHLDCEIDGERVRPQPGGFYGGWLTDEIVGPVKGALGTGHW